MNPLFLCYSVLYLITYYLFKLTYYSLSLIFLISCLTVIFLLFRFYHCTAINLLITYQFRYQYTSICIYIIIIYLQLFVDQSITYISTGINNCQPAKDIVYPAIAYKTVHKRSTFKIYLITPRQVSIYYIFIPLANITILSPYFSCIAC